MLRTITIGSCVSVQGLVVGHRPDGRLVVRVDQREFTGTPVKAFSGTGLPRDAASAATRGTANPEMAPLTV